MKVMVIVKAGKDTEAGVMPSPELLAALGKYTDELVKAGIVRSAVGLHPSGRGARVTFSGTSRAVQAGPFGHEQRALVAGFWLWEVTSMEEAIEWVKRCPNPTGDTGEIEIRPLFATQDFADAVITTPADREAASRA